MKEPATIERTIDAVAPYLRLHVADLEPSLSTWRIFPLRELAERTGTSVAMLGKLRKRYKRAIAQSLTPGADLQFEVAEQSYYGRAALTIRRLKPKVA